MGARLINNLCQIIPLCHNKLKLATYFPDSTQLRTLCPFVRFLSVCRSVRLSAGVCGGLYLAFKFFIMAKSVSLVAHLEKCLTKN